MMVMVVVMPTVMPAMMPVVMTMMMLLHWSRISAGDAQDRHSERQNQSQPER